MKARYHPVFDNPIRMGYVAGWSSVDELVQRLGDLEQAVGERRVVPATWEPYYHECPSCRWAGAYVWAQSQLQNPAAFAQALAFFPGEQEQLSTPIGHANWLILSTKSASSHITRKLMPPNTSQQEIHPKVLMPKLLKCVGVDSWLANDEILLDKL